MPHEFVHTRRVEFAETDMAGIAHYTNFFKWMEETEHAFFRSLGLSIVHRTDDGLVSWPRVSVGCDYARPALFEDEITVRLRVDKRAARSLTFSFRFFKGDSQIAKASSTSVCCRIRAGHKLESIDIPPLFDAIAAAPEAAP